MKNILWAITLFYLLLSASCAPKTFTEVGGTVVTCQFPDMQEKGETPEGILNLLKERIQSIKPNMVSNASYNPADSTFTVEVPLIKGEYVDLLFTHGEMSMKEVAPNAREIIERMANDTLTSLFYEYEKEELSIGYYVPVSVITSGVKLSQAQKDTLVKELNKPNITKKFPGTQFIWSHDEDISLLHAIKTNTQINLNKTTASSKIETADYGPYIHMILNKAGGDQLYELTNRNKGLPIAVVCDDIVLSFPTVNNSIEGGNMTISGNFDLETLAVLKALLRPNTIKSTVKIIDKKEVAGK